MLEVLIADDNEGMRLVLKKAVESCGCKVAGEAGNGQDACDLVEKLNPQVVFIDVEMPIMNGVEAAKRIQDFNPRIFTVFITAHDEFRKEAFEIYAYDYLVKPFEIERIERTLKRIELTLAGQLPSGSLMSGAKKYSDKLMLRHKEGVSLVDVKDIVIIQRENRSTAIYTTKEKHITSETLSEIEQRLPGGNFFRCHKSYIINIERITKIYPYGRWTYIVKLSDTDMDALMTQERYAVLQTLFN